MLCLGGGLFGFFFFSLTANGAHAARSTQLALVGGGIRQSAVRCLLVCSVVRMHFEEERSSEGGTPGSRGRQRQLRKPVARKKTSGLSFRDAGGLTHLACLANPASRAASTKGGREF